MPDLKKQYKKPPTTFGNVKKIKNDLALKQKERRKQRRRNNFEENREKKPSNFSTNSQTNKTKRQLLEWKAEREKKKEQQSQNKKPPFVVGIVHHRYFSPITTKKPLTITKKTTIKIATQISPTIARAIKSPAIVPACSSNEFPTNSTTKNIEVSTEEKEQNIEYFKHLLYKEKDRLQKHCEHWMEMQSGDNIKEDIRCRINQAVGQTTLLIKKKFSQFHGLILICEKGDADVPVTCTDLHGFWDMMYLEVKDCNSRFAKLEELRARHWQEEQSFSANAAKKKTDVKRQAVAMRQSLLRSSISDKKKKEMAKMRDENSLQIRNTNNEFITPSTSDKKIEKSINSTHHKCRKDLNKMYSSTMYTSTPFDEDKIGGGSSRLNMSASLITLKISQLYKSAIHMDDTMLCISSEETPRKSILEKSRVSKRSIRIKSISETDNNNLTLRKQCDLETDQNSQVSLKKVDSFEFEEMKVHELSHIERRPEMSDSLDSTVIEKTIADKNDTLKWTSHNTDDLIETPVSTEIKDKIVYKS